jgi:hypothetical protein
MTGARGATAAILALAAAALYAQAPADVPSARTWVGHEAAIEAHLKTARVTRIEDIGTGVTHPRRAYLDPAEPVASMTWKVLPPGRQSGYWESYKSEVAAYELDQLLEMKMVPPAVERSIDGDTGAAIMWIDGVKSVKQTGGKVPSSEIWGRSIRRMQMFDNLIGNPDRNAGNILLGRPGELILIDHSRAFETSLKLPFDFERVDATLWARMTALTRDEFAGRIGAWVGNEAVDAMIERRTRLVKAVDALVKKKGRGAVIIP